MAVAWGIIGPGEIANNFPHGFAQTILSNLIAVA
jgi:hypothetical protein